MEFLRKGLKKGHKFMDGKRCFIVDEVLDAGRYLSHEIREEEAEEVEGSCLNCKTAEELRDMARELGLHTSGKKGELITRIEEALAAGEEKANADEETSEHGNDE